MKLSKLLGPATLLIFTAVAGFTTIVPTALGAPRLSAAVAERVGNQASQSQTLAKPPGAIVPAPALNPLDDMAWMKGGTWVAEVKDATGAVATRIETRIRGSENGHLIKFTTTFVEHNRPHLQYEGVYLYDPQSKQIQFYYTDSDGNLTRGRASFANNTLTQDFDIVHLNGQADTLRSLVIRDGENAYNWNVMSQKNGQWKELIHLHYMREKSEN